MSPNHFRFSHCQLQALKITNLDAKTETSKTEVKHCKKSFNGIPKFCQGCGLKSTATEIEANLTIFPAFTLLKQYLAGAAIVSRPDYSQKAQSNRAQ